MTSDKYKTLAKNSGILGAGAMLSKLLIFILLPIYSSAMSTAEYGIADLVAQSANLLFPIVTLGICQSVFRFSFGKSREEKTSAFSSGVAVLFFGLMLYIACVPLLKMIAPIADYTLLLGMYVFMYGFHTLCGSFLRGLGKVTAYSVRGIVCTAATIVLNILFLLVFRLGVVGYLLANIAADFITVLFMVVGGQLLDYVDFRKIKLSELKQMLKFAVPLIPATICWWVINMSDRYLVTYMVGEDANGVYSMAYKIPNILITVTGIFTEAWQMSLVNEENKKAKWGKFFTGIFDGFKSVMFVGASGLILLIKPITKLLIKNAFYPAWRYMPYLIMACVCTGIVSFLAVVFIVKKKSRNSLVCAACGAVLNIILNLILIKSMGAMGAAVATLISYFTVYLLSTYLTRKLVNYRPKLIYALFNLALLLTQSILTVAEVPGVYIYSAVITLVIIIINFKGIYRSARALLKSRRKTEDNKVIGNSEE